MNSLVNPLPQSLQIECQKAAKILTSFIRTGPPPSTTTPSSTSTTGTPSKKPLPTPDSMIPADILQRAQGLAILSIVKAGFIWSGRIGSGIVLARLPDGGWSAPSAIGTAGVGVGGQIGAELVEFVMVLNTAEAVRSFSSGGNVTLGGNLSVAAGPVGRSAEAAGSVSGKGVAAVFSYSKSKGLFAGISLEGSVIMERKDANEKFYHRRISAKEILSGAVPPPPDASDLYRALENRAGGGASHHSPTQSSYQSSSFQSHQPPPYSTSPGYAVPAGTTDYTSPAAYYPSSDTKKPPPTSSSSSTPLGPPPAMPPRPTLSTTHPHQPPTATALFDYTAQAEGDLSFTKGDIITIVKRTDKTDDWWEGEVRGKRGTFPANYVRLP